MVGIGSIIYVRNILFKDDGFGPFVIHKLEEYLYMEDHASLLILIVTFFISFLSHMSKRIVII